MQTSDPDMNLLICLHSCYSFVPSPPSNPSIFSTIPPASDSHLFPLRRDHHQPHPFSSLTTSTSMTGTESKIESAPFRVSEIEFSACRRSLGSGACGQRISWIIETSARGAGHVCARNARPRNRIRDLKARRGPGEAAGTGQELVRYLRIAGR